MIQTQIGKDRDVHYAGSGRVLPTDHESHLGLTNTELDVLREVKFAGSIVSDVWVQEFKQTLMRLIRRGMIEVFAFAGEGPGSTGWSFHITEYGQRQLVQADHGMPDQAKSETAVVKAMLGLGSPPVEHVVSLGKFDHWSEDVDLISGQEIKHFGKEHGPGTSALQDTE